MSLIEDYSAIKLELDRIQREKAAALRGVEPATEAEEALRDWYYQAPDFDGA